MLCRLLTLITMRANGNQMNEIRTYMEFTYPVDPVHIRTIPDMDISYALGSTLIGWDSEKQITAAIAEKWAIQSENIYRFTLSKDAKWSNGLPMASKDIKASFERGLKLHPHELRSLANILERIECPSALQVDFHLKVKAKESGLLSKLTEPNYSILKLNAAGQTDLAVTSGAFSLSRQSTSQELVLIKNKYWYHSESVTSLADRVLIRRAPTEMDAQTVLIADPWLNLIETSSLIKDDLLKKYSTEGYQIWRRPFDKLFYFNIGRRANNAETRSLLKYLHSRTIAAEIGKGLSGFQATEQFFPLGYQLHDRSFACVGHADDKIISAFQKRPLEILISPSRVSPQLRENIRRSILKAVGVEPRFLSVSLENLGAAKVKGEYDLYAGTVGLADPDPEGAMSFYLETDAPLIETKGTKFVERLDQARKESTEEKKLLIMRSILTDAVCNGYVLPVFHLSTLGLARGDLDLSQIPESEESIMLSKVRFRGKK